jgi:hypothetical protein
LVFIQTAVPKNISKNIQLGGGIQQEVEKINGEAQEGLN